MTETGWAGWLAERHVQERPVERLYRQAMQGAERQERAEAAAEAERAVEVEEERDRRLLAFQLAGVQGRTLGDVAEEASRAASEDDQYQEALKTIERIDKRRERRAEAMRYQSEQLAAVAERSARDLDPMEAATRRAHQAFREATRAALSDAAMSRAPRAPRPKGYGAAVRSEPVTCQDCLNMGATPEEAFAIHHPELLPASAGQAELPDPASDGQEAGRRGYSHGRVIRR
jgi:hypothetical protein